MFRYMGVGGQWVGSTHDRVISFLLFLLPSKVGITVMNLELAIGREVGLIRETPLLLYIFMDMCEPWEF